MVVDNDGNWSKEMTITLTVDSLPGPNTKPTVTITSPKPGTDLEGNFTIKGTAEDEEGTLFLVEISLDGEFWESLEGTDNWSYQLNTSQFPGEEQLLWVRAFDGQDYSDVTVFNLSADSTEGKKTEEAGFLPAFEMGTLVTALLIALDRKQRKRE